MHRIKPVHRIVQFGPKEIDYHPSIALTNVVFKKVRTNDAASPKSTPNSNFLWIHCHLANLVWVCVVPYTAIVFVNIAIHPKMRHVTKDDFSGKIGVLFQMLRSPVSEQTALSIVNVLGRSGVPLIYGCCLTIYRTGCLEFGRKRLES